MGKAPPEIASLPLSSVRLAQHSSAPAIPMTESLLLPSDGAALRGGKRTPSQQGCESERTFAPAPAAGAAFQQGLCHLAAAVPTAPCRQPGPPEDAHVPPPGPSRHSESSLPLHGLQTRFPKTGCDREDWECVARELSLIGHVLWARTWARRLPHGTPAALGCLLHGDRKEQPCHRSPWA